MADNRPRGREKNITGVGKSVYRRGSGLGTGPVGNASGYKSSGSGGKRAIGGGSALTVILVILFLLFGGKGGNTSTSGSGSSYASDPSAYSQLFTSPSSGSSAASSYSNLYSSLNSGSVSTGWTLKANTGTLNKKVDPAARPRYTSIFGNGTDTVTIMVYMCGTDLESRSGMATADLNEMAKAAIGDKVNLIVYTGGCTGWKNSVMSSSTNQIYQVTSGGVKRLVDDAGNVSMTKPSTLTGFIQYCDKNFPANRYELILWDHGGGSLSGYGYDQKFQSSGSMTLKGLGEALYNADVTFDFIGFDACLMATAETAMTLAPYADYLIASEETEPGIGWYYTNWLTEFSKNTSMPTIEVGKKIVDDFVDSCATQCRGQKTTLAVIDLAELQETVPANFKAFSVNTTELIQTGEYKTVSDARAGAREFSTSKIDQVDLVHLASGIGSDEAQELIDSILSAVKYNRTSGSMTDAYGLSIYFPYRKVSSVDSAVKTYDAIGIADEYSRCIQAFAGVEASGQAMSGGQSSPYSSLLGQAASSSSSYSTDALSDMIGSLLGGNMFGVSGLSGGNTGFLGRSMDAESIESTAAFLSDNRLDPTALVWKDENGVPVISLPEDQWELVHELVLNLFLDDGEGFIDMGLDTSFEFTDSGALIGRYDGTWTAINGQPVAYYHVDTVDDGENYTITGRVPVFINGERAELILVFDNDHPYGYVAGARRDYRDGETETIAKGMTELQEGDVIDFLCDYYSYDGDYIDSYMMGDPMTVTGSMEDMEISYVYIDKAAARATYRFTDIYGQEYWSPVM